MARRKDDGDPRLRLAKGDRVRNSWSVSSWNVWSDCARQYLLDKIKKLYPFTGNAATERGTMIHKKLENYLLGKIQGVPDELRKIGREVRRLKELKAEAEAEWTLTADERQTTATDWGGAWLRAKVDANAPLDEEEHIIVDLKSGRPRPALAQKQVYAGMSKFFKKAERVVVELLYCDQDGDDRIDQEVYTAREVEQLWTKWKAKGQLMLRDREFQPKPGKACERCAYRSNKTLPDGVPGPCDAWKLRS